MSGCEGEAPTTGRHRSATPCDACSSTRTFEARGRDVGDRLKEATRASAKRVRGANAKRVRGANGRVRHLRGKRRTRRRELVMSYSLSTVRSNGVDPPVHEPATPVPSGAVAVIEAPPDARNTGVDLKTCNSHNADVQDIVRLGDGRFLSAAERFEDDDNVLHVYTGDGRMSHRLWSPCPGPYARVELLGDDAVLVSDGDGALSIMDAISGGVHNKFPAGAAAPVTALARIDATKFAVARDSGTVDVELWVYGHGAKPHVEYKIRNVARSAIHAMTADCDGRLLYLGCEDGSVLVYNVREWKEKRPTYITTYHLHQFMVKCASASQQWIATGDARGRVVVYPGKPRERRGGGWKDPKSGAPKAFDRPPHGDFAIRAMEAVGDRLITVGGDRTLCVSALPHGQLMFRCRVSDNAVPSALRFIPPDGVAVGCEGGAVTILSLPMDQDLLRRGDVMDRLSGAELGPVRHGIMRTAPDRRPADNMQPRTRGHENERWRERSLSCARIRAPGERVPKRRRDEEEGPWRNRQEASEARRNQVWRENAEMGKERRERVDHREHADRGMSKSPEPRLRGGTAPPQRGGSGDLPPDSLPAETGGGEEAECDDLVLPAAQARGGNAPMEQVPQALQAVPTLRVDAEDRLRLMQENIDLRVQLQLQQERMVAASGPLPGGPMYPWGPNVVVGTSGETLGVVADSPVDHMMGRMAMPGGSHVLSTSELGRYRSGVPGPPVHYGSGQALHTGYMVRPPHGGHMERSLWDPTRGRIAFTNTWMAAARGTTGPQPAGAVVPRAAAALAPAVPEPGGRWEYVPAAAVQTMEIRGGAGGSAQRGSRAGQAHHPTVSGDGATEGAQAAQETTGSGKGSANGDTKAAGGDLGVRARTPLTQGSRRGEAADGNANAAGGGSGARRDR